MGLGDLLCMGRPDVGESDYQQLIGSSTNVSVNEKKVADDDDGEDEMQGRLSDLRSAINDAKIDW